MYVRAGRLAEQTLRRGLFELGELADGTDAEPMQFLRCDRPDAPEPFHREREQELLFPVGFDEQQPVGFAYRARDLGEELGASDPDRDGETDLGVHPLPQSRRDLLGGARDAPQAADFQKRLVDRQTLHKRGRVAEDPEHILTGRGIRIHARRDDDGLRAQVARLPATHRGAHAARFCLIAGGKHHAAADDDRPAAQSGCIALLDRGVERVQVGVQHGRLAPHPSSVPSRVERMVARAGDIAIALPQSAGSASYWAYRCGPCCRETDDGYRVIREPAGGVVWDRQDIPPAKRDVDWKRWPLSMTV